MEAPRSLKHKPIWVVDFYNEHDGYKVGNTDAEALSLGLAQWNDVKKDGEDKDEPSLKVWRYTDKKWSRQSEELPLHRVIDLSILLCSTMIKPGDDPLNKDDYKLDVRLINKKYSAKIKKFIEKHEKEHLKPRLKTLKKLLDKII